MGRRGRTESEEGDWESERQRLSTDTDTTEELQGQWERARTPIQQLQGQWERARTPIQQLLEVQGQLERLRTNTDTTVALYSTYDIQLKRVSVCHSTILIQLRLWLNPQPLAQSVS